MHHWVNNGGRQKSPSSWISLRAVGTCVGFITTQHTASRQNGNGSCNGKLPKPLRDHILAVSSQGKEETPCPWKARMVGVGRIHPRGQLLSSRWKATPPI